tara:strand:- start:6831 stop:7127 length:297 start_codon:yes stop_codon:yes gene_type:complete
MNPKITLKADFDNGEGWLGNRDKWRDAHSPLLRADILKDWMYCIEKEYASTIYEMRGEYADFDKKCNPHPDAPHGFCRDSSLAEGRNVCECESWEQKK